MFSDRTYHKAIKPIGALILFAQLCVVLGLSAMQCFCGDNMASGIAHHETHDMMNDHTGHDMMNTESDDSEDCHPEPDDCMIQMACEYQAQPQRAVSVSHALPAGLVVYADVVPVTTAFSRTDYEFPPPDPFKRRHALSPPIFISVSSFLI